MIHKQTLRVSRNGVISDVDCVHLIDGVYEAEYAGKNFWAYQPLDLISRMARRIHWDKMEPTKWQRCIGVSTAYNGCLLAPIVYDVVFLGTDVLAHRIVTTEGGDGWVWGPPTKDGATIAIYSFSDELLADLDERLRKIAELSDLAGMNYMRLYLLRCEDTW